MAHPHSNLVRIIDNFEFTLNSLAAVTGILGASKIDAAREQGFRTLMQRGFISSKTNDGSGGPIRVYMLEADLNLAEAEEAIENDPQDAQDVPATEHAKRWIGYLATDRGVSVSQSNGRVQEFRTKHQRSYPEGSVLQYLMYNTDTSDALDAANTLQIWCEHVGVWLRD